MQIVNNTVDGNTDGIRAFGLDTVIANNAVTNQVESGLVLPAAGDGVSNHHNLLFGNATDLQGPAAGSGSVFANPLYAGANDFHLSAGSPAIGAGDNGAVPPELDTDLDGDPRIIGAAVDIGAFEAPEPVASLGAGISVLAIAALRARSDRRRRAT